MNKAVNTKENTINPMKMDVLERIGRAVSTPFAKKSFLEDECHRLMIDAHPFQPRVVIMAR